MGTARSARRGSRLGLVLVAVVLFVGACGSSDESDPDPGGTDEGGISSVGKSDGKAASSNPPSGEGAAVAPSPESAPFSVAIPPDYASGAYLDLGGIPTASFESGAPVADTVERYTGLLGAPVLVVEGDGGEQTAQWQSGDWIVSVVGSPDESLIGISKPGG